MTVINTNVGALMARTYATKANDKMQTSMERLSSGLRINSAADDAAGLAVANKMQSYEELSQIDLLGSDHESLINRLVPQYERLAQKYEALMPALLNQFEPELNLSIWRRTLNELLQNNK